MQTPESQKIIERFFETIAYLKEVGVISGITFFAERYNIDRRNLHQLRKNHEKDIFQVAWLAHLVKDYNVNPTWLLTGTGKVLRQRGEGGKPAKDKPDKK